MTTGVSAPDVATRSARSSVPGLPQICRRAQRRHRSGGRWNSTLAEITKMASLPSTTSGAPRATRPLTRGASARARLDEENGACLLLKLPADTWDVVVEQGLTPDDLARLSQTCRGGYGVAHAIASMRSIVHSKLRDGLLELKYTPVWDDRSRSYRDRAMQCWAPRLARRPRGGRSAPEPVAAWPHLLFVLCIAVDNELPGPQDSWQLEPNILLVLEMPAWDQDRTRACTEFAQRHHVHAMSAVAAPYGMREHVEPIAITAPLDVHSFTLNSCKIADLASLANIHTVDLSNSQDLTDVSALSSVHTARLHGCSNLVDVAPLAGATNVDLSFCSRLVDASALANVHSLNLYHCGQLKNVTASGFRPHTLNLGACEKLSDLSGLGGTHIHDLDLSGNAHLTDVSMLYNVYSLNLNGCTNIVDVSALGSVHTIHMAVTTHFREWDLHKVERNAHREMKIVNVAAFAGAHSVDLRGCTRVVDVSALAGVPHLKLKCCTRLKNVTGLGNRPALDLSGGVYGSNKALEDVSSLGGVGDLNLAYCRAVEDVSALGTADALNLSHCTAVKDVSSLGSVANINVTHSGITSTRGLGGHTKLDLSYLAGLTDVSGIESVQEIVLHKCASLVDVSPLASAHSIKISECHKVLDIGSLAAVQTLKVNNCQGIVCVAGFGNRERLDLTNCTSLADVAPLGGVKTLRLSGCSSVTNPAGLGAVSDLDLSYTGVADVAALATVHTLTLRKCKKLKDVSMLGAVHTLDISECNKITDVSALGRVHNLKLEKLYVAATNSADVRALNVGARFNAWCASLLRLPLLAAWHRSGWRGAACRVR